MVGEIRLLIRADRAGEAAGAISVRKMDWIESAVNT